MAAGHKRVAPYAAVVFAATVLMMVTGGTAAAASPTPADDCSPCLDAQRVHSGAAATVLPMSVKAFASVGALQEGVDTTDDQSDSVVGWIQSFAAWAALALAVLWYYRFRASVFDTRGPLRLFDLIPLLSPRVAIEPFDTGLTGEERGEAFASRIRYEMKYLDASTDLDSLFLSAGTDAAANLTSDLEKFGEESKLAAAALSLVQRLLPREQWNASGSLGAVPRPNATVLLRRGSHVVAGLTLELPPPAPPRQGAKVEIESDYRAMARGVAAWIAHHMSDHLGSAEPRPWPRLILATLLDMVILGAVGAFLGGPVLAAAGAVLALGLSAVAETRTRDIKPGWVKTTVYYRAASAAFLHTGLAFSERSREVTDEALRSRLRSDAVFMYQRAHQTDLTNLTAAYSIGYEKLRTPEDNAEAGRIFDRVIDATRESMGLETHPYDHLRDQALYNRYVVRLHVIRQMLRASGADLHEIKNGLDQAGQHLDEALVRARALKSPKGRWQRLKAGPGYEGARKFAERTLPILKTARADLEAAKLSVETCCENTAAPREYEMMSYRYKELSESYTDLKIWLATLALGGVEVHMAYYNLACRNATLFGMFNGDPCALPSGHDKEIEACQAHLRRETTEMLRLAFVEATEFRGRLARWATKDPCLDPIREIAPADAESEHAALGMYSTFDDWISSEADQSG